MKMKVTKVTGKSSQKINKTKKLFGMKIMKIYS